MADDKPQRIEAREVLLSACIGSGHVTERTETGRKVFLIFHACGQYTLEDANFCQYCGASLKLWPDRRELLAWAFAIETAMAEYEFDGEAWLFFTEWFNCLRQGAAEAELKGLPR